MVINDIVRFLLNKKIREYFVSLKMSEMLYPVNILFMQITILLNDAVYKFFKDLRQFSLEMSIIRIVILPSGIP